MGRSIPARTRCPLHADRDGDFDSIVLGAAAHQGFIMANFPLTGALGTDRATPRRPEEGALRRVPQMLLQMSCNKGGYPPS
jgi:hypothetical protein